MRIVHRTLDPVNDKELIDSAGGSLQGHITTTRAELEKVFGAPSRLWSCNKITTEWIVAMNFEGYEGQPPFIAWIYDWKQDVKPELYQEITWNIGGDHSSIVSLVNQAWPKAAEIRLHSIYN